MALNVNDTKFLEIAEIICEEGLGGLDKAVQIIINQAMLIGPILRFVSPGAT